jgi:hypothetical protein
MFLDPQPAARDLCIPESLGFRSPSPFCYPMAFSL